MKKTAAATILISALLTSAVAGVFFVRLGKANPYVDCWPEVSPLAYPTITLLSPAENNTLINKNNLTITFNAEMESGTATVQMEGSTETVNFITSVGPIYYKPSWQPNNSTVTLFDDSQALTLFIINLTEIPEGTHFVTITAVGHGTYPGYMRTTPQYPNDPTSFPVWYGFESVTSYILGFTVDTVGPIVTVFELNHKTFTGSEVPLSFTVNDADTRITYSLDGQENITTTGNTTLANLAEGNHSLTVYVIDEAGNTGSQTIAFSVALFPTELVLASILTVVAISTGLLVYFKKLHGSKSS